jgi:CubicO group peptidase (beta-lactamase class C family)
MLPKSFLLSALLVLSPFATTRTLLAQGSVQTAAETQYLLKAKPTQVGMSASKLAKIDETVAALIENEEIAGAVTIVVRDGKVIYEEAAGYQNLQRKEPMAIDSIFRIYSMTKPIVSTAIMILRDEGKLKLDEPVSKYVPELKGLRVYTSGKQGKVVLRVPDREMTLRDLLRHTAGLTYGYFGDTEVDGMYRTAGLLQKVDLQAMAEGLAKLPLLFSPGEDWNYSVASDLLGHIIELVSGASLDQFLSERIFAPLGMVDTGFHVRPDQRDRFTTSYGPGLRGLRVVDDALDSKYLRPRSFLSGGGGLVSSGPDYARFCQMLLNKGTLEETFILSPNTVGEMTRNQLPSEAFPIGFSGVPWAGVGFGLGFSVVVSGDRHHGEYGWGGAASTHFWISPVDNLFVVTLSQYQPFSLVLAKSLSPIVYQAMEENL